MTALQRATPPSKKYFPNHPSLLTAAAKNISDKIISANHWGKRKEPQIIAKTRSKIEANINRSGTIHNNKNGRSANIPIGSATDSNVIYAAKCKKHQLMYVGMTGGQRPECL